MDNISVSAVFLSLKEKAGTSAKSNTAYSFATLRAMVGDEVLDLSLDLQKVKIADFRALSPQDEITLSLVLVPSGKGGYEALEPRVRVVGLND